MSGNYTKAEVVAVPCEKKPEFHVMLGDHQIGISKTDFDARFHMHEINKAIDEAFEAGKTAATEAMNDAMEEALEIKPTQVQESGPRCKRCGSFTTYTRVNSHGLCMGCETVTSKPREFCLYCGAGVGKFRRDGEGTCPRCDESIK